MYVIIVGCGKIGYYLTRALLNTSNEVAVIERDSHRSDRASAEFGSIVISSDGTEPTVLSEAGANRCDMLIATTGVDATNLVACQVAKWSFNVPKTISVVTDPDHVDLFKSLGVDVIIDTTELILSHIEEELPGGPLVHLLPQHGASTGIVCVRVPPDSPTVGQALAGVPVPAGTKLTAVIGTNGEVRAVDDSLRIQPNDRVIAITRPEHEDQLWKVLTGEV